MWEYPFSKDTWARERRKKFQTKQRNICRIDKTTLIQMNVTDYLMRKVPRGACESISCASSMVIDPQ